jgi:hypothetical protein
MAQAKKNEAESFKDKVDEVVYGLGDGAGPMQYPHERADWDDSPRDVDVEVVDSDDPSITPSVFVTMDEQTPMVTHNDPAGYGSLDLPIHAFVGAKRVEDGGFDAQDAPVRPSESQDVPSEQPAPRESKSKS